MERNNLLSPAFVRNHKYELRSAAMCLEKEFTSQYHTESWNSWLAQYLRGLQQDSLANHHNRDEQYIVSFQSLNLI